MGVWVWGFGVCGFGFGVWGSGFEVWGVGFGVWGVGFGVWGVGFGVNDQWRPVDPDPKLISPTHCVQLETGRWYLLKRLWGTGAPRSLQNAPP